MANIISIAEVVMFFTGISFLACFYWLINFFYSKNKNYLFLVLVAVSMGVYYLTVFNVLLRSGKADNIILGFIAVSFSILGSAFIQFKQCLPPFIYRVFFVSVFLYAVIQLLLPLLYRGKAALAISHWLTFFLIILVCFSFIYIWLVRKKTNARFAFFIFLPQMSGYIIFALAQLHLLPGELKIAGPIGASIFLLLTFYGMVIYIISLRRKKIRTQKEKEDLIYSQKILLEQKVKERTIELEAEKKRTEELLITAAQKQMTELELQNLRARLNPHFMFNSLTAIQQMILKEDFTGSHTYLSKFSRLLRLLLEDTDNTFIPLQKEIEFVELYLSLEKLRIPDLEYSIMLDPALTTSEMLIPNMILQPYIENALWHGLQYKTGSRMLIISIERMKDAVIYRIRDNGIGRKKSAEYISLFRKAHKSKGMDLLAKRFQLLNDEFGSDILAAVTDVITNGEVNGTEVAITIPDSLFQPLKDEYHDTHHYY